MSYIKFNQVFGALMLLAVISAFLIPPKYTDKAVPQVQALFAPVSAPARSAGLWLQERVSPRDSRDKRSVQDVKAENQRLRDEITGLAAQLVIEQQRNAQWQRLGSLKERCVPVDVLGGDSGVRDSLALDGSTLQHVREGDVGLFPGGVAGQIHRAGLAGSQLRLITDRGFKVRGHFVRIGANLKQQHLTSQPVGFEGIGEGVMVVRPPLSSTVVKGMGLTPGDVAVVADRDWPGDLEGRHLGVVTAVGPNRNLEGFDEIRVEPATNLEMLREVMVLVKKK